MEHLFVIRGVFRIHSADSRLRLTARMNFTF